MVTSAFIAEGGLYELFEGNKVVEKGVYIAGDEYINDLLALSQFILRHYPDIKTIGSNSPKELFENPFADGVKFVCTDKYRIKI